MVLYRELIKIAKQFQGSKNIFGYKYTVANQLYLFYCFSGRIYFTKKITNPVKYLWYGIVLCQILFSFVIGWAYLWYEAADGDFVVMLNVASAVGVVHMTAFALPSISFLYRNSIETMIKRVDYILVSNGVSDLRQKNVVAKAKQNFLIYVSLGVVFLMIFFLVCFLDVVLLFEEEKVKNYLYYALPVFLIREYSSIESYCVINGITTLFCVLMAFEIWATLGIISYWNTVWYSELKFLRDELNMKMFKLDFGEYDECSEEWNEDFECALKCSIGKFQKITLLVNDLRGFFETFAAVFVPPIYFNSVFYLYNIFSSEFSTVLLVKYVTALLTSTITVFFFYWIGQNLENSVFKVSMAVYSTPWYRSIKVRKNVYLFLCQTQSVKTFTFFKVCRLPLSNFSRYLHALMSFANILRKLTQK